MQTITKLKFKSDIIKSSILKSQILYQLNIIKKIKKDFRKKLVKDIKTFIKKAAIWLSTLIIIIRKHFDLEDLTSLLGKVEKFFCFWGLGSSVLKYKDFF